MIFMTLEFFEVDCDIWDLDIQQLKFFKTCLVRYCPLKSVWRFRWSKGILEKNCKQTWGLKLIRDLIPVIVYKMTAIL